MARIISAALQLKRTGLASMSNIYTPPQAAAYALEAVERMSKSETRGIALDLPEIRDYFAPVMPGQLVSIIAQTSNYKSSFMRGWERMYANQLMAEGREDESIIHVSVEEVVEEQVYQEIAALSDEDAGRLAHGRVQDWDKLKAAAVMVGQIPIYRIGDSLARPETYANLHSTNIIESIQELVSGAVTGMKVKPAGIFVDYLQALPFDPGAPRDRRLQVKQDIYRLRKMGVIFDCGVITAVQAKQNLQGAPSQDFRMPGIYDGEESSSIAQRSDRVIQLWMPKMTHGIGTVINHNDFNFVVTEDMLWVTIGKQRGGLPSGKSWLCKINHTDGSIVPQAVSKISLKGL